MVRDYPRPRVVISQSVRFDACRYDGSKIPPPAVEQFRSFTNWIPVFPEVEIGLGIPRATVRIVRMEGIDHLIQTAAGRDVSKELSGFAERFPGSLLPVEGSVQPDVP